MKMRNFFYAALAFVAVSCAEEVALETPDTDFEQDVVYVQKTFTAGVEGTRTSLVNGNQIDWQASDDVAVFDNVTNKPILYETTESGASTTLTSATGVASTATEFYAWYQYRDKLTISGDVISGSYLTPDQRPSRGKYYVGAHFMMSKADDVDNFTFKTVNAFIKVTIAEELDEQVHAIYIFSNNDEEISGDFKTGWNDGAPKVEYLSGSSKRPYVRAYNTAKVNEETVTVPLKHGDYYLSILPTEFTEGFTLVLQMVDGTQLTKRTEKNIVVAENQILPMKKLAKEDYSTDDVNYFVLWNEGFTFKMGNVIVDKVNYPSSQLRTKNHNAAIDSEAGLFFVTPSAESVVINTTNSVLAVSDWCVVGTEKKHRATVALNNHLNLAASGKNYLLANLDFAACAKQFVRGNVGAFDNVAVKNCGFRNITTSPFNFDQLATGETDIPVDMNGFIVEDSEFGYNMSSDTYLLLNRQVLSTIDTLIVHNNVFYSIGNMGSGDEHRILYVANNADNGTQAKLFAITNNTFSNMVFNGAVNSLRSFENGELNMSNNIFCAELTKNVSFVSMPGGAANANKKGTLTIQNNCTYLNLTGDYTFAMRSWNGDKDTIIPLSINPLSDLWEPANGKFGAYTIVPAEGAAAPTGLVGAQRPDMDPVTAAVNSAAYGYETNDLGKL